MHFMMLNQYGMVNSGLIRKVLPILHRPSNFYFLPETEVSPHCSKVSRQFTFPVDIRLSDCYPDLSHIHLKVKHSEINDQFDFFHTESHNCCVRLTPPTVLDDTNCTSTFLPKTFIPETFAGSRSIHN